MALVDQAGQIRLNDGRIRLVDDPIEQTRPGPPPIVDVISRPAPPVTIITAPAQQQGFQLTSTQLIIGIVILLLVLKK